MSRQRSVRRLLWIAPLLAMAGGILWGLRGRERGPVAGEPGTSGGSGLRPRASGEGPAARLQPADPEGPGRRSAAEPSAPREGAFADASALGTKVSARFVDAHGAPLAQVELRAAHDPGGVARSTADGRAELSLGAAVRASLPGPVAFEARCAGFARERQMATVHPGERLLLGDWILVAGGSVEGRVLDEDGVGVAGAEVACLRAELGPKDWPRNRRAPFEGLARAGARTFSQDDGAFLLEDVPAGSIRLVAVAPDRPASASESVDVPAGGRAHGVTIRMEAALGGSTISGVVLDPDGSGVPYATVQFEGGGTTYVVPAGEDGRFEVSLSHGEPCDVTALDPEQRHREALRPGVRPGTADLVLQLTRAPGLELLVLARAGSPIETYAVATLAARNAEVLAFQPESERPAGRCVIAVPAQDFHVEVRANGWRPARLGPFAADAPPPRLEFPLDPAGGVLGVVQARGVPVSGARVGLYEGMSTREMHNGFPLRTRKEPLTETESDASGGFALSVERRGSYFLRVEAEGHALAELGPLELAPDEQHEECVELGRGGTLEVSVRSSSGASTAGKLVAVSRGDGLAYTQRTDEQGRTTFRRLTPGPWQVALAKEEIDPRHGVTTESNQAAGPIPSNCRAFEGETTRVDLWLEPEQDGECRLTGRLVIDGEPAEGWLATLDREREPVAEPRGFLEPGVFRLALDEPGSYRLSLRSGGAEPGAMLVILDPLELLEGEQFWSLELDTGVLEGGLESSAPTLVFHRWRRGALECFAPLVPDASGRFRARVPAGRGALVRLEPNRPMEDQVPVVLRELELAAGETLALDL